MLEQLWNYKSACEKAYGKSIEPVCESYHLSRTELDILLFLANNPQFDTATDVVEKRGISKSHVSESVKSLEEKGYLMRSHQNNNRRTIHLTLCPKADEIVSMGRQGQIRFAETMMQGFSPEELQTMREFVERMARNVENNGK